MEIEETALRDELVVRLHSRFVHLSVEQVRDAVTRAQLSFLHAKVRLYLPLLIERSARSELLVTVAQPRHMASV